NSGDQTVVQGATVSNTITATLLSGSSQSVVFSASGLPTGASATFSPTACTPTCTTTLTLATTTSTPTGPSTITVTGTGGGLTRTTTFTLTVTAPPPAFDFSLTNSGDQTVVQGATVSNTITATLLSGTSQSVVFSASELPTGASATFAPTACTPTCTTTLTLTTTAAPHTTPPPPSPTRRSSDLPHLPLTSRSLTAGTRRSSRGPRSPTPSPPLCSQALRKPCLLLSPTCPPGSARLLRRTPVPPPARLLSRSPPR